MAAAKLRDLIREEVSKGCRPDVCLLPVALEPPFQQISLMRDAPDSERGEPSTTEAPMAVSDLLRIRVWISPEEAFDWIRSELFIKQLQTANFRVGFEVCGNNRGVTINLLCHVSDLQILAAAFRGQFLACELTPDAGMLGGLPESAWRGAVFRDYFPPPPYSHLLTRPSELHLSPLISLMTTLASIEEPALGLYQVMFQAINPLHNWHRNVEILLDFEYAIKLHEGFHPRERYAQQSPSGDLRNMAAEVETKANNDKGFFAAALRLAVFGTENGGRGLLRALEIVPSLFQHGGRPLEYVTEKEYARVLSPTGVRDMFVLGLTYRPGFLVNSLELTGLVHIPALKTDTARPIPLEGLETLPVRNPDLRRGTWIGICAYAGMQQRVCIPDSVREKHAHLIGRPGSGKSTLQMHMILSDIMQGHGVAVLDPHGDLIESVLCLIPEAHVHRTVYLNPGDPDWVPIWNPLKRIPGQDIGRTADDIVRAIQSFVTSGSWGDRLEHLLRNMIFSLIHLPKSTFLDLSNLLRNKSQESKNMTREILAAVDNESVRQFWIEDYDRYGKDDLGPPRNKLSKLLVSGTVSLMLSQPESLISFRQIMDGGMILLVDLSGIGSMVREILGCFILSLIHLAALSRSSLPLDRRKQFHVHCDEAHRFMTDSLEDLIAETRKYKVSLSLAHQYMSQFGKRKTDAFSSVGTTVIFNLDTRDAQYLAKDLRKLVDGDDIVGLEAYQAIARIGTDIVRIRTRPPSEVPQRHFRDRIIDESHKKYYRSAPEVRKWIERGADRWHSPHTSASSVPEGGREEDAFVYDEFTD